MDSGHTTATGGHRMHVADPGKASRACCRLLNSRDSFFNLSKKELTCNDFTACFA